MCFHNIVFVLGTDRQWNSSKLPSHLPSWIFILLFHSYQGHKHKATKLKASGNIKVRNIPKSDGHPQTQRMKMKEGWMRPWGSSSSTPCHGQEEFPPDQVAPSHYSGDKIQLFHLIWSKKMKNSAWKLQEEKTMLGNRTDELETLPGPTGTWRAHEVPTSDCSYNFPVQVLKISQENSHKVTKAHQAKLCDTSRCCRRNKHPLDSETAPSAASNQNQSWDSSHLSKKKTKKTPKLNATPRFDPCMSHSFKSWTRWPLWVSQLRIICDFISLYFKYLPPLPCLGWMLFTTEVTWMLTATRRGCSDCNFSKKDTFLPSSPQIF